MHTTYYRTLYCLATFCFMAQLVMAEQVQVKLLNPDGSPAIDAQAIAIKTIGTRVDEKLKELPSLGKPLADSSGIAVVTNESGVLKFESTALAVLAQSPTGFAFMPLPLAGREVKLRPWAKLKIDLTAIAPQLGQSQQLYVVWENCFAGYPPRPLRYVEGDDPFGEPTPAKPSIDWRFDSFVAWTIKIETAADSALMQEINVPPGEVVLFLSDGDFQTASVTTPIPYLRLRPTRTLSGYVTTLKPPELLTVKGRVVGDANLPDWRNDSDKNRMVYATPADALAGLQKLISGVDPRLGERAMLDEVARRYVSEAGLKFRYELVPLANARVNIDGTFQLTQVRGQYELSLFDPSGLLPLKQRGATFDQQLRVDLTTYASPIDVGEVERLEPPREQPKPPTSRATPVQQPAEQDSFLGDGSINRVEAAEQKIRFALSNHTVNTEFAGLPLNQVIDELSLQCAIPIRINYLKLQSLGLSGDNPVSIQLPAMTLQSALRNTLSSLSDELAFTIRDEVLLITTKEDAARDDSNRVQNPTDADLDSGDAFLEHWSKNSLEQNAAEFNQVSLRRALKEHLEKEFDTKQQTRRAELDRLRALLKQSEDWLNTRQSRRAEIVGKKVDELVEKARK